MVDAEASPIISVDGRENERIDYRAQSGLTVDVLQQLLMSCPEFQSLSLASIADSSHWPRHWSSGAEIPVISSQHRVLVIICQVMLAAWADTQVSGSQACSTYDKSPPPPPPH